MIDTKLNQYIRERGMKSSWIARQLGLTYQGFHKKMTGKSTFSMLEAMELKRILDIRDEDMNDIFMR